MLSKMGASRFFVFLGAAAASRRRYATGSAVAHTCVAAIFRFAHYSRHTGTTYGSPPHR
jgi:hypothetical protein